jgi:hypothetical protein
LNSSRKCLVDLGWLPAPDCDKRAIKPGPISLDDLPRDPGRGSRPQRGRSKAYAEAMREISMRARELSLGAERTRRWRQKRQQGVVVVSFDVAPDVTGKLIRFGWLDPNKRDDKEAIARALVELAEKATELEVTPASCST